jgi:hypothetical protein
MVPTHSTVICVTDIYMKITISIQIKTGFFKILTHSSLFGRKFFVCFIWPLIFSSLITSSGSYEAENFISTAHESN